MIRAHLDRRTVPLGALVALAALCLPACGGSSQGDSGSVFPSVITPGTVLGTAGTYGVLGAETVTNTGPTDVAGNVGVHPGLAITGKAEITLSGPGTDYHEGDAHAQQAQVDLDIAFSALSLEVCNVDLTGQDLGGLTLTQGVYCFASSAGLTGTLTLDAEGDPNALFIFQIGSTLTTATDSAVVLENAARNCNVFWVVGSSATLGERTAFQGNILALTSITLVHEATILGGSALARDGAVTLDTNRIAISNCEAVAVDSVTTLDTSTSTPTAGDSVVLTATVTSVNGPATGTVTFFDGGIAISGPVVLIDGVAMLTTTTLPIGPRTITAEYSGDVGINPSVSNPIPVDVASPPPPPPPPPPPHPCIDTCTVLCITPNPATSCEPVLLVATVASSAGPPSGAVTFYDGGYVIGSAALVDGRAEWTTSTLSTGAHSITAVYSGAACSSGTSPCFSASTSPPVCVDVVAKPDANATPPVGS